MNRRSLLSMLGIAPVMSFASAAIAQEPVNVGLSYAAITKAHSAVIPGVQYQLRAAALTAARHNHEED